MSKATVNEVRVRLGKLIEHVFTPDFREIYEMMVPQLENQTERYIVQFLDASDAYLRVVSSNLSTPEEIAMINKFVYPPVVYCIGVRYHLLSCELVEDNQTKTMEVPDDDAKFFEYMMINYCK